MSNDTIELSRKDFYAPDAEQTLIAGLVMNPDFFPKVKEIIRYPDTFHSEFYKQVFSTIDYLIKKERAVDYVTILESNKKIDSATLSSAIVHLPEPIWEIFPHFSQRAIETYATLVAEASARRMVASRLQTGTAIKSIMAEIAHLERQGLDKFFSPKEIALQVIASFARTDETLTYPFREINKATNGIHKGEMIIVACRPGCGKSSFIAQVAWHVASQGKKVLFATAEMGTEMIGKRIVTQLAHYNLFYDPKLEMPTITNLAKRENILKRVKDATELLEQTPFYIHEMFSVPQLEAIIMEKARDFDLVVVDYIQLLSPAGPYRSNYEKITAVSQELHKLAMKYHLPILVAAQYNREVKGTQQPTMEAIKESGQIEQDADVIISLWNSMEDEEVEGIRKVRYDILKNRSGYSFGNTEVEKVYLIFNKRYFEMTEEGTDIIAVPIERPW